MCNTGGIHTIFQLLLLYKLKYRVEPTNNDKQYYYRLYISSFITNLHSVLSTGAAAVEYDIRGTGCLYSSSLQDKRKQKNKKMSSGCIPFSKESSVYNVI